METVSFRTVQSLVRSSVENFYPRPIWPTARTGGNVWTVDYCADVNRASRSGGEYALAELFFSPTARRKESHSHESRSSPSKPPSRLTSHDSQKRRLRQNEIGDMFGRSDSLKH
jgi:hypothetical protein